MAVIPSFPSAQSPAVTADTDRPNGGSLAAILAAGIGAFAMGLFVVLSEAGIYGAPTLYGPAGGLSGRSTFAVVTWLAAWLVLHRRWRHSELAAGRIVFVSWLLIALGVLGTFPPFWGVL
jgi:hypothetical protein